MRTFIAVVMVCALLAPAAAANKVAFFASKVEGKRDKKTVNPWFEATLSPRLKPCFESAPALTTWTVKLEIAADGKVGKPSVTSRKTGESASEAAAPAGVADCVTKAVDGAKIDGKAAGTTTVSAKFVVTDE